TAHAALAEIFFCMTVAIAVFTSPQWVASLASRGAASPVDDRRLRVIATTTTGIIFLQILIGAAMRHTGAGLAIPDFPWMFGHVVPDHWDGRIAVHFTHSAGALIVTLGIGTLSAYVWSHHRGRRELTQPATLIVALVATQVTLGALTVLTGRDVWINKI